MKNLILTIAMIAVIMLTANATTRTVSNDPTGGAQFNSLLAGYNASSTNDTLLVEGTNIIYDHQAQENWNKNLVVIGIGYNPQKQSPRRTIFGNFFQCCNATFRITNGASGSRFFGIEFNNGVGIVNSTDNLIFENCKFDQNFNMFNQTVSNFIWRNCVFTPNSTENIRFADNTSPTVSNMLVSNCIFNGYIEAVNNQFITLLLDHCLFLGFNTFNSLHFAIIQNSIFMNVFPGGTTNSSFANNLCRVVGTFPPAGGGGNSGANNIEASDPNFLTYTNNSFYSSSHDYHLQVISPANGAATDGTDIGVHGGLTHFSESGEVLINPIMRGVSISNSTISPNGTLNVNIHAAKPTDH